MGRFNWMGNIKYRLCTLRDPLPAETSTQSVQGEQLMLALRRSNWRFDTGSTGGAGLGPLLASGGKFILTDPAYQEQAFYYGGCGIGWSKSASLFKMLDLGLPRFFHFPREVTGTGSTLDFTSSGSIYMTSAFHGKELKRSDMVGASIYIDADVGIVADGYGATIMLLGMNSALMMMGISMPQMPFFRLAISEAPAVLVMRGFNVGLQSGAMAHGRLQLGGGAGGGNTGWTCAIRIARQQMSILASRTA